MAYVKQRYKSNEIIVNNKSNFKSLLVRCQSIMDDTYMESVVIRAMGKATPRAVNLALQLNKNNFNSFLLKTKTYTVEVLDDRKNSHLFGANKDAYDPDQVDLTKQRNRRVPAIEISVKKNPLEVNQMRKLRLIETITHFKK